MLQCPGSSWGFGALLKDTSVVVLKEERALVIHSPTNNPCRTWDSNPQPLDYKSDSLTIRPRLPFWQAKFDLGFTLVDEDTNRGAGGNYVFLWYRRSTDKSKALTALNASTTVQEEGKLQAEGFIMLSVNLNEGTGGNNGYAWYRKEGCESQIQAMVLLINPDAWKEYQKLALKLLK